MRKLFVGIFLLLLCGVAWAQQANFNGLYYAAEFAKWSFPPGQNLGYTWPGPCTTVSGGLQISPFFVGTPVAIQDANPAQNEVLIPSAVNSSNGGCSVSFNPAPNYAHYSYQVVSATAGLQEAINYAERYSTVSSSPTSVIVLTPEWTTAGGTSAMVLSAQGTTAISILDQRTAACNYYTWSGSAYVAQACGGGGGSAVPPPLYAIPFNYPLGTFSGDQDLEWDPIGGGGGEPTSGKLWLGQFAGAEFELDSMDGQSVTTIGDGGIVTTGGIQSSSAIAGGTTFLAGDGLGKINLKAMGAKGDERFVSDAAMSAGSYTVTSATAAFTPADTGKTLTINAGSQGVGIGTLGNGFTYVSGGTVTGDALGYSQYCVVGSFGGGGTGASGMLFLTGLNSLTGGMIQISSPGSGYTSLPTSAILSNGSATCSGTITFSGGNLWQAPIVGSATYVNATTVALSTAAITTVTNAQMAIGTDDSAAILAAIAKSYALKGQTLYAPAGSYLVLSQLLIPNNSGAGEPSQPPITLEGEGGVWDGALGREGAPTVVAPASQLDLRYSGAGGKIETLGRGVLTIRDISLQDHGFDSTPFVHTASTTIFAKGCSAVGSGQGYMASTNDGFVLGAVSGTQGVFFEGYGTVIGPCFFDKVRRAVYAMSNSNAVNIKDITVSASSGGDSALYFDGTVGGAQSNVWMGNLIEVQHYLTGVTFLNSTNNYGALNTFWDGFVPSMTLAGTSTGNSCIGCNLNGNVVRDIPGSNPWLFLDGPNLYGSLILPTVNSGLGSNTITIGGLPNVVGLAPLDVTGTILNRNGSYKLGGTSGTATWGITTANSWADLNIQIPGSADGLFYIVGANHHVLINSTTDNTTDMFQVNGSAYINNTLKLLTGNHLQFDTTASFWDLYQTGTGITASFEIRHSGTADALVFDGTSAANATFSGNVNIPTGKAFQVNSVSGVTKTCTTYPTVVGGIVTGC